MTHFVTAPGTAARVKPLRHAAALRRGRSLNTLISSRLVVLDEPRPGSRLNHNASARVFILVMKVSQVGRVPMGSGGEQQMQAAADATSPADFLLDLGKALREKENIDTDLAEILAEYLLTATPAVDAVAKAKDAIVKLAVARADPPQPDAGDG